ncbi:hypothetical protein Vafri_948, partial [Volvox africanus]
FYSSSSSSSRTRGPEDLDSGMSTVSANPSGASTGRDARDMRYSQRIARLRKPALTAADKLAVKPKERARIFQLLWTPRRRVVFPGGSNAGGGQGRVTNTRFSLRPGLSHGAGQAVEPRALLPLPLRIFCYGIDDVRLYRALEPADARYGYCGLPPRLMLRDRLPPEWWALLGDDPRVVRRSHEAAGELNPLPPPVLLHSRELVIKRPGKAAVAAVAPLPRYIRQLIEAAGWPVPSVG